jgi:hypothetical protein
MSGGPIVGKQALQASQVIQNPAAGHNMGGKFV